MKAQVIYKMEEVDIEDRKEFISAEQQDLQPTSPKEEFAQHSSNDERDHGYQRTREKVTTQSQDEKQNDIADHNEQSHELTLVYESDPPERNIRDPYDKNPRYSEKQKNGSKNYNRKRIRSSSIHSEDSYYSRPSEELHMATTPPPPPPPHPDLVSTPNRPAAIAEIKSSLHNHHHRPRTPFYDSEIPPPSWHSNNRMPRKDYFTNDRKKNRMRYRNRDFNYERVHSVQLFDRIRIKDRSRIPERERDFEIVDRKERYDRERERELRIEREREREIREREITRPRDNPTRYYEESHPRMRAPYYEYGREADRMRAPYYDYHREPDFRERDYPRYREFDWEPYYHRASPPPPGHFPYKDNMKRPNDYFYQPPVYPRRSISPRARYSHNRRSLSPNSRRLSNPTYERRYERDRPPRYDLVRDNEFDARRDSVHYNAPHYNELQPGFDHYASPVIPPSPINMKSYEDNGLGAGVGSTVNESYERERPLKSRNWDINADKDNREGKRGQSNSNDIPSGGYEHERERGRGRERRRLWDVTTDEKHKHMEVDNHSNSTIVSTSNNNSTQDRTRDRARSEKSRNWNSNDDKYRDINTDRNNDGGSDATKESYERHVITREKSNKYWDKDDEKSSNTTKNRERDNRDNRDEKERGDFDQVFSSKK